MEKNNSVTASYRAVGFFPDIVPKKSEFETGYEKLLSNREFENLLMNRIGVTQVVISDFNDLETQLNEIIFSIDQQLKNEIE